MCMLPSFEREASASPDAFAITSEDHAVTYRELNDTADRIAYGLKKLGVARGTLVGVLLDRSPEMAAGLLGIWKAGGAYMPLDPTTPLQRIAFTLKDADPAFVLTRSKYRDALFLIPPQR